MAVTCDAHQFEEATGRCRACGRDFCPDCLVYTHGEGRPPFCIPCAFSAAGVRTSAGRAPAPNEGSRLSSMSGKLGVGVAVGAGVLALAVPVAQAIL